MLADRTLLSGGCVEPPAGQVGWWPGDGNATDIAGSNNGTLLNGVTFAPGKVGQAFSFDGADDQVRVPNALSLEPARVTVEAWVKATNPGRFRYLVEKGAPDSGGSSYALYTGTSGGLSFVVHNNTPAPTDNVQSPVAGPSIWDGNWHHVAGTYDGARVRLYVDGLEIGTGTPTSLDINYDVNGSHDLFFGNFFGTPGTFGFTGQIDEVSIYNRALNPDEIQSIYNAGSDGKCKDKPDIAPTSLTGNTAQGGVDFGYEVTGADLTQDTTAALYWASGTTTDTILEPATTPIPIPKTTPVGQVQTVHLAPTDFPGGPAPGATHLLLVVDPNNVINESDENNNSFALAVPTNHPPEIGPLQHEVLDEGSTLLIPVLAIDPDIGDQLVYSLDRSATFNANGAKIDPHTGLFTWTPPDGLATAQVTVRVTDNGTPPLSDSLTFSITVNNVPPTASITGPSAGVRGQSLTFTLGGKDVSPKDQAAGFRYVVTWGDGAPNTTIDPTTGNGTGLSLDHIFAIAGTFTVRVTAFDKDGAASQVVTHTVTITAVGDQADPLNPGMTVLAVGGTPGPDVISVVGLGPLGMVVLVNGNLSGPYFPTSRVEVYGQAGNDAIILAGLMNTPAWLFGGDGNDLLVGGNGDDVLVGGDGNDILSGGKGGDVLIGGRGSDLITGDGGDDLLIAGFTAFDNDPAGLKRITDVWSSSQSYSARTSKLRQTDLRSDGPSATVFDDGVADILIGASGQDWFFAQLDRDGGSPLDLILDRNGLELVDDLDRL